MGRAQRHPITVNLVPDFLVGGLFKPDFSRFKQLIGVENPQHHVEYPTRILPRAFGVDSLQQEDISLKLTPMGSGIGVPSYHKQPIGRSDLRIATYNNMLTKHYS